jgi:hypothetical protein
MEDERQEKWRQETVDILRERMEGNAIYRPNDDNLCPHYGGWVLPSFANTGPQGVYAYHIWQKACIENRDAWLDYIHGRQQKMDFWDALKGMVITFDEDGNPVSSVDLAKYGLSMPVITPKPTADDYREWEDWRGACSVVFPHETETSVPPESQNEAMQENSDAPILLHEVEVSTSAKPQRETPPSPPNHLWTYVGVIIFLIGIGSLYVWREVW